MEHLQEVILVGAFRESVELCEDAGIRSPVFLTVQ
jgi:hypothetical protein